MSQAITPSHYAGAQTPGGQSVILPDTSAAAPKSVNYICGQCFKTVSLKEREPIRCRECGFRILYKERTRKLIVFDAR